LANNTGIIDSDYVDPLYVVLYNLSDTLVMIKNGERIAQGMLQKTLKYTLSETTTKPEQKTDRDGGLGSTN
jgi:dUTPase